MVPPSGATCAEAAVITAARALRLQHHDLSEDSHSCWGSQAVTCQLSLPSEHYALSVLMEAAAPIVRGQLVTCTLSLLLRLGPQQQVADGCLHALLPPLRHECSTA